MGIGVLCQVFSLEISFKKGEKISFLGPMCAGIVEVVLFPKCYALQHAISMPTLNIEGTYVHCPSTSHL